MSNQFQSLAAMGKGMSWLRPAGMVWRSGSPAIQGRSPEPVSTSSRAIWTSMGRVSTFSTVATTRYASFQMPWGMGLWAEDVSSKRMVTTGSRLAGSTVTMAKARETRWAGPPVVGVVYWTANSTRIRLVTR